MTSETPPTLILGPSGQRPVNRKRPEPWDAAQAKRPPRRVGGAVRESETEGWRLALGVTPGLGNAEPIPPALQPLSPQRLAPPKPEPRVGLEAGPQPFPEFRLAERLQVSACHLQRDNSKHLLKVQIPLSSAGCGRREPGARVCRIWVLTECFRGCCAY